MYGQESYHPEPEKPRERKPWEVLGVSWDADEETVKRAYRRLARELHPDKRPNDPNAENDIKALNNAKDAFDLFHKRMKEDPIYRETILKERGVKEGTDASTTQGAEEEYDFLEEIRNKVPLFFENDPAYIRYPDGTVDKTWSVGIIDYQQKSYVIFNQGATQKRTVPFAGFEKFQKEVGNPMAIDFRFGIHYEVKVPRSSGQIERRGWKIIKIDKAEGTYTVQKTLPDGGKETKVIEKDILERTQHL